ncbi:flavodoxin family protein [Bacillus lacus]|uniref:Flavodoxin family protein n=1 Tax=Metabacillus lacus TaxID=1983721 RepID=A0A7X2LZE5_9BACI|nr:flavodoxin family protein [Metabacillus lacus]
MFVLYGSSRENGNSEQLASIVLENVPHTAKYLRNLTVFPITDLRHDSSGFQDQHDDYDELIREFMEHDTFIFVTPLYWYGMSGSMKDFFDRWSQAMRSSNYSLKENLKGKRAFVLITGGDNPRVKALPLVQQFQYIFDFVSISFEGYVIGKANQPGDILNDDRAITEAKLLRSLFSP